MTDKIPHEHLNHLARAAADNDAVAEEFSLEEAIKRTGLDVEDVRYVAEQRALRVVMLRAGQPIPRTREAVSITVSQRIEMAMLTAIYMDGILIGWRAQQLATEVSE